jgi:hypothetical protein
MPTVTVPVMDAFYVKDVIYVMIQVWIVVAFQCYPFIFFGVTTPLTHPPMSIRPIGKSETKRLPTHGQVVGLLSLNTYKYILCFGFPLLTPG